MQASHTIGERIRAVRQRAELPLDQFAAALGYSRRSLINWEQNAADPPIAVLAKLRQLYDVDPEWVVMGKDLEPRSRYGTLDWARFDRLAKKVDAACNQVGVEFEPDVRSELIRGLFEDDPTNDEANLKQLYRTLHAIAKGRPL